MSLTEFQPYRHLIERTREIALLDGSSALLYWDQQTFMPPKALEFRAEQLSYLGGRSHRLFTAPEVGNWLLACEDVGLATSDDTGVAANVRGWRRRYDRATRLPATLVEAYERAKVMGNTAWMEARRHSDFSRFAPFLETMFTLTRQLADLWGYEVSPYDALLEGYEPGAREAALHELFSRLQPALVALLGPAAERSAQLTSNLLTGHYPVAAQEAFNREVAEALGFDFDAGNVTTTAHPFCSGVGAGDCRLTTRYDESNFLVSLYGVMHEVGHGLYEQGLPVSAYGTPAGSAVSLGIHESQSRLWENQVGRGREFWEHWLPRAIKHFPSLKPRTPEEMFAAVNRVEPSFIRTEADALTYDLHIVLRFGLERRLLDGSLKVRDVPAAWNEEFETMFGLKVPDDAHGCLQDIHWSEGLIGYFPTYTLGNLNAAQLFHRALTEIPSLPREMAEGKYARLLGWLRDRVHAQGERLSPGELIESATGEKTQAEYYLEGLREKFTR